jgi:prepilin-type N-terminal cleavage/methylation domain-containing protein/prepilin-type processing-associated H-X9-DG protein
VKTQAGLSFTRAATKAFTLIELLVVILIILILAALLFPSIQGVKQRADSTACASNLHQIGVALSLYALENQATLPGTFWGSAYGQQPYIYDNNPASTIGRTLPAWLQPYLNTKASANGSWEESKVFKCPSFMRALPAGYSRADPRPYVANNGDDGSVVDQAGNKVRPFGIFGGANPVRLLMLSNYKPLSQLWALTDLDAKNLLGTAPKWIPATPVHGSVRNTLFFDWHVETVKVP